MNLKEAFRYQSFIQRTFNEACGILKSRPNMLKATEHHMISAADPDAQDKDVERPRPAFDPDPEKVVELMDSLVRARENLTKAIAEAKNEIQNELDALIETNKMRQNMYESIQVALNMPTKEVKTTGTGYKFNNDGNQMPFSYDITYTPELRIPKAKLTEKNAALRKETNEASNKIDSIVINTNVNFTPPYDVDLTLEEILS